MMKTEPIFKVYIQNNVDKVVTNVGETVTLKCSAHSKHNHVLTWFREGDELLPPYTTTNERGLLVLKNVKPSHSGTYTCIGSNIYATDDVSVHVYVNQGNEEYHLRT